MTSKKILALFMVCVVCVFAGVIFAQSQDRTSSFVDERDGQTYRAVLMPDGKTWMAQNLNFETESGSWCYDDDVANCEIYGRLYDWNTAMTACPQGWRLPSYEEWQALINSVGVDSIAGTKLKSQNSWFENGNGTDDFEFSALPGGYRWENIFNNIGLYGYWWTATKNESTHAWQIQMSYSRTRTLDYGFPMNFGSSVRCVRGD